LKTALPGEGCAGSGIFRAAIALFAFLSFPASIAQRCEGRESMATHAQV